MTLPEHQREEGAVSPQGLIWRPGGINRNTTANRERHDGRLLGLLHAVALAAGVAGAGGSLGLMLRVGHGNPFTPAAVGVEIAKDFGIWTSTPTLENSPRLRRETKQAAEGGLSRRSRRLAVAVQVGETAAMRYQVVVAEPVGLPSPEGPGIARAPYTQLLCD